jgi:hypothetical protein
MTRVPAVFLLTAVGAVLALAGCGGSGGDSDPVSTEIPGGADPAQVEVIDRWARALTAGDVDAAAELFAIPSVAQNGPTFEIADRDDARLFNASLPCGAELVEARPEGELTIATFELTERPGPGGCGTGVGAEASTAFRIADGEIVEWRRVAADGDGTRDPEPAPSSPA